QGDYLAALKAQEESLSIREEIGFQRGVGIALNSIGMIYDSQGNYDRALDYYMRSLEVKEALDDKRGMAGILNNLGIIYDDLGEYDKAIQYYRKSLLIKEEIGDKLGIANSFTNLAAVYKALKVYDSAIYYNERSLDIKLELGDKLGLGSVYHNMGNLFQELGESRKAMGYYQKSIDLNREIGDRRNEVSTLVAIGMASLEQKDYLNSVSNCLDALSQAEELGAIPEQELACDCLYNSYKALGNSNKALVYHEQMLVLNDSLKLQETSKKLQQMEFAKQVMADSLQQVEKDLQVEMAHQAEVRQKDRNRNLAIGAGIFFLVLSGGFYSRWRYVRKSKKIIEKEKDRSDNLLLNILPHEIAEELKLKGSVDAQDFDQVSVLFTDFKGFTSRSEKLTAKALVSEINECFKAFDHICGNYNIEKIKTIGDAYMAGGGLPVPSDDAVKNTILAALEMQDFMQKRTIEKKANNEIPFEMRVGIHTGPVVAGIVGVKKFQYDIWGDTVNTASRMESSGEVGKVNISQTTYNIIKDDPQFAFESRGKIKAKGKGEVEMYFISKSRDVS
ncbi:MAG: adenylate/guanylate cyclase domain-containing protein, partial [Flavobacteriaceae bacterium]